MFFALNILKGAELFVLKRQSFFKNIRDIIELLQYFSQLTCNFDFQTTAEACLWYI